MFLVTTALQDTWKRDEKILFLGKWCQRYSQKQHWTNLEYEIFPYHWDDRKKLYADFQYLAKVYEKYLASLGQQLNEIHQLAYPLRYWRIVVGPWLRYFIEILFDRYDSIVRVAESGKVSGTWIIKCEQTACVPQNMQHFEQLFINDAWNHFIYAEIIRHLDTMAFQEISASNFSSSFLSTAAACSGLAKRVTKKVLGEWSRLIPSSLQRYVFSSSYLRPWDQVKLQWRMKSLPCPFLPSVELPIKSVNCSMRQKICFEMADTGFEFFLENMIPKQIPLLYLEGYTEFKDRVESVFPKKPKYIGTAVDYSANEAFKIWSAKMTHQGSKLIILQHGGHFGTGLLNQAEDHQCAIADSFYTWGWCNGSANAKPMPSGKLMRALKIKPKKEGYIFCSFSTNPRYSYQLYSVPVASQHEEYINDQLKFLNCLNSDCQSIMRLRVHPADFGWDMKQRLEDNGYAHLLLPLSDSFLKQLSQCRLAISTYNATTYLETFAANIPSLLFWNPQHWELREEAKPYFDALREQGILHNTPESAAKMLNKIYQEPEIWWQQAGVQKAKNEFCRKFARTSKDWIKVWQESLTS